MVCTQHIEVYCRNVEDQRCSKLEKDKCSVQTRLQKLHYNYGHAVMHFIAGFKFLPPLLPLTGYNTDRNEAVIVSLSR